jgi:hypothetical protein
MRHQQKMLWICSEATLISIRRRPVAVTVIVP